MSKKKAKSKKNIVYKKIKIYDKEDNEDIKTEKSDEESEENIKREKIEEGRKFKYIYHMADIHIMSTRRHEEYLQVFDNLFKKLEKQKNKEKSIAVICGDILHLKVQLSGEINQKLKYLLHGLSKIMTTIIIAGNHDLMVTNEERTDPPLREV